MIHITRIDIAGTTERGDFSGTLKLSPGLNVVSAKNAYGKSLATIAVPWCLGLETMFGVHNNDPTRFPPAVRDVIDIDGTRDVPVLTSRARIVLQRHDGAKISLCRVIKGAPTEVVDVTEKGADGSSRVIHLLARKETLTDATGGLQNFLFEWIGLPHASVMTLRGTPSPIYLENLAPLFYIDQNEGWTDIQALQVHRYGQQEITEAAIEYLLGAEATLRKRFAQQQRVSLEAKLKGEAERLSERVEEFFRAQGWTLRWSTHGTPAEIAKRWSARSLTEVARDEFHMDAAAERQRLEKRIVALRKALASGPLDPADMTAASQASQQVVDLKTRRHELRTNLRDARTQLADQRALLTTIEHRIHSSTDVLRLKRQGIGRLELVECPTCHRELDPSTFQLTEQSDTAVSAHIDALQKERVLIQSNLSNLERRMPELTHEIARIDDQLAIAERALDTVTMAVGTVREKLAKVATDLASAERELDAHRALIRELGELETAVRTWLDQVRIASTAIEDTSELVERRETFTEKLRNQLLALGHSAITRENLPLVQLDDRYVPYLGSRRVRSLGSASDQARLVAAYVLALAEASHAKGGPHPGFIVLDEPLQQNPDPKHRNLMVRFLKTSARATAIQLVVLTSLRPEELNQLKEAGVPTAQLGGDHFLRRIPNKPPPAAPSPERGAGPTR